WLAICCGVSAACKITWNRCGDLNSVPAAFKAWNIGKCEKKTVCSPKTSMLCVAGGASAAADGATVLNASAANAVACKKSRRPIRQLRAIVMKYPLSQPVFTECVIAKGKAAPFQLCQQG